MMRAATKLCAALVCLRNLPNFIGKSSSCLTNFNQTALIHKAAPLWAGHSKWANIKHTKGAKDGQRAATFNRLTRQMRLAIQDGGSNPATNSALKNAMDIALKKNMPMSTIQNTIKKFESNKTQIKEYQLEIKAFNRVYMVCVLYTDNFAGLKMNLAPTLRKAKAAYVDGQHLFDDIGIIEATITEAIKSKGNVEETCTDDAIEIGAEEVDIVDQANGLVNFLCPPSHLNKISKDLSDKGYVVENVEHVFMPKSTVTISSQDLKHYEILKEKILAIEGLERIYDNLEAGAET